MSGKDLKSTFPIPSSLQDLERAPYNLLPYPNDFDDDDEAARADSFDNLADLIERGNRTLISGGLALFGDEEGYDEWMDQERIQALYTLVRKSCSLAASTRSRFIAALCQAVQTLSSILSSPVQLSQTLSQESGMDGETGSRDVNDITDAGASTSVMSQSFRDAFACHLYMLFSVMFMTESEAKMVKTLGNTVGGKKKSSAAKEKERKAEAAGAAMCRESCAAAMLAAAQSMGKNKSRLWRRGVADEDVVSLPCRIAYQMLESATGVLARKASSADAALGIIAATVDYNQSLLSTVVAALVDLLHSYEHMSPLVAELCSMVSEEPTNVLAVELLREIGRLDTGAYACNSSGTDTGGKASGIKNVAPFIGELAIVRPRIVLSSMSLILPHLDSEPHVLRSSIATAIGHIAVQISKTRENDECDDEDSDSESSNEHTQGTKNPKLRVDNTKKTRDALLGVLTERVHDVSSFTRGAVLKAWASVTESNALPLDYFIPVTALAIDRLQDKTVMCRRSAMQLLTLLLENNPFMESLDPEPFREKLIELEKFLAANIPQTILEAKEKAQQNREDNGESKYDPGVEEEIESAALAAAIADAEAKSDSDDMSESEIEFYNKVKALKFVASALEFIDLFENSNESFEGMLLSSNASDVTEALRFFVRARHFKLPCAVTGMKQALALMWSNETSIQEEVLKAFLDVFISVPGTDGKEFLPDNQIAHNLLVLVSQATVSELASIEEALGRLVKQELIPAEVFVILWSIATKASKESRSAAMTLLSMGASADTTIVDSASRLRLLHDAGLGDYTEEHNDWKTARSAACALQHIKRVQPEPGSAKCIVLELIMEKLCAIARGDWCDDTNVQDTKSWFCAAQQAIDAIFVICPEPEIASAEILRGMESTTFGFSNGSPYKQCHSLRLSRFFFVLGHVALKLLVYTEAISGAVRRANAAKTLAKQIEADKAKAKKKASPLNDSQCDDDSDDDDAIEAELGVAAEAEAETEREVADISDNEIVGRALIGCFVPTLLHVVANKDGRFSSEILMQTSTLALCKLMCISSAFCEKHLPLLFTALARAPSQDTTLRANTVIALGDLAFRFPNAVEPYTPRIYACLRDKSTRVRRHALMVLTHLILNDMVKVKGQVSEIALCLRDDEARIRDMARLLFNELSKRSNNPIYNLLPDIVSRLSQMGTKKEDFRSIMFFLLGFIKKEKQNEMLVEKLCHRFPKCNSISQKADLAFCIAQLKINEKSLKCLNDLFKLYKDALFDEDVFKSFASIVSKAKKFIKPEMKQGLEEWEARLSEHSETGMDNVLAGTKAQRAKVRAAKRAARNATRATQKKYYDSTDDEEESEDGKSDEEENASENKENSVPRSKSELAKGKSASNTREGRSRRLRSINA